MNAYIYGFITGLILLILHRIAQLRQRERDIETYNDWLEERLRMAASIDDMFTVNDPDLLAEQERTRTEGCDLTVDEARRLRVYVKFLERLP